MSNKTLSELKKNFITAAMLIAFLLLVTGIVMMVINA